MALISDRITDVAAELGNRQDLSSGAPSRVATWLKNSYLSIAMGYNFEQLEGTTVFGAVSSTYQIVFPATARAINALMIYDSSGSPSKPDFKDIETIRRRGDLNNMSPGRPSVYTLYNGQLLFSPPFDTDTYEIVLDTWNKPVIAADTISTVLNVPDDWLEAIDYGAMMRGHAILGEPDKALVLQRMLYGYTDPTSGKFIPGLLSNLQTRKQANAPARDYGLQPKVMRQGYTR